MKTIVVTDAAGKAGQATVKDLIEHGYEVTGPEPEPNPMPRRWVIR